MHTGGGLIPNIFQFLQIGNEGGYLWWGGMSQEQVDYFLGCRHWSEKTYPMSKVIHQHLFGSKATHPKAAKLVVGVSVILLSGYLAAFLSQLGRSPLTIWVALILGWVIAMAIHPSTLHLTGMGDYAEYFILTRIFVLSLAHMGFAVFNTPEGNLTLSLTLALTLTLTLNNPEGKMLFGDWIVTANVYMFVVIVVLMQYVAVRDPGFVDLKNCLDGAKQCPECKCTQPLRAVHTNRISGKQGGRCVVKFDHWCPFVNNAIGVNNEVANLAVYYLAFASCSFNLWVVEQYLCEAKNVCGYSAMMTNTLSWQWRLTTVGLYFGGIQTALLSLKNTLLVLKGRTLTENIHVIGREDSYMKLRLFKGKLVSPFARLGVRRSIMEFCQMTEDSGYEYWSKMTRSTMHSWSNPSPNPNPTPNWRSTMHSWFDDDASDSVDKSRRHSGWCWDDFIL